VSTISQLAILYQWCNFQKGQQVNETCMELLEQFVCKMLQEGIVKWGEECQTQYETKTANKGDTSESVCIS
jgi:hypothetical protein